VLPGSSSPNIGIETPRTDPQPACDLNFQRDFSLFRSEALPLLRPLRLLDAVSLRMAAQRYFAVLLKTLTAGRAAACCAASGGDANKAVGVYVVEKGRTLTAPVQGFPDGVRRGTWPGKHD
jgi:hypothetical protein